MFLSILIKVFKALGVPYSYLLGHSIQALSEHDLLHSSRQTKQRPKEQLYSTCLQYSYQKRITLIKVFQSFLVNITTVCWLNH